MTSSDGSFSSPTGSSSRCWLAWLLSEARLSSQMLAISFSASYSMSSHGSISPIFVSFHSVCSCLSLSPSRTWVGSGPTGFQVLSSRELVSFPIMKLNTQHTLAGESAAGRKGTRRSEKAKVPEEVLLTRSSKPMNACAYLRETTNIKHTETLPRLANTWKCRGY